MRQRQRAAQVAREFVEGDDAIVDGLKHDVGVMRRVLGGLAEGIDDGIERGGGRIDARQAGIRGQRRRVQDIETFSAGESG
jgi:hypothetical protein